MPIYKKKYAIKVQQAAAQLTKLPVGYNELIGQLKKQILTSRLRAAVSVNRELILFS